MKLLQRAAFLLLALLLSAVTAWAQDEAKAPATPTNLPGEEKLSAQERAERDFLMPVRRKQAAKLRATAEEVGVQSPVVEATAHSLEALPEAEKPAPVSRPEVTAAPTAAPHRTTYHRSRSSASRRSIAARRKTTAKRSTAKKKTTRRR